MSWIYDDVRTTPMSEHCNISINSVSDSTRDTGHSIGLELGRNRGIRCEKNGYSQWVGALRNARDTQFTYADALVAREDAFVEDTPLLLFAARKTRHGPREAWVRKIRDMKKMISFPGVNMILP